VQVLRNLPAPASQPHLDEGTGGMGVRRKLAALAAAHGASARAVQLLRPRGTRPAHLLNGCGHRPGQGRAGERVVLEATEHKDFERKNCKMLKKN
jgi:hypothetical protein